MLEIIESPVSASDWCASQRAQGLHVGFVPTMGALHAGHQALIERSLDENDVTCASIFVNPLQFNDPDDYETYPRQLDSDYRILEELGCDMVFSGTSRDMFPEASSLKEVEILDPGPYAVGLEGDYRPGHLEGVCTVVDRLFRFVGECRAYFGLKDYQQLLVVQHLAESLGYPQVIACETVRENSGLALSSRNRLLSDADKTAAKNIFRALIEVKKMWNSGIRDSQTLSAAMKSFLDACSINVEYAQVRDPRNWRANPPVGELDRAVALIAVKVGGVRLIDNLRLDQTCRPDMV
ncbi:MAG: pantoate--beta-alanine ligase [Acidiferrobacterales bacterium]|nr:pantoate--beta-alanine ligase [Acidiferrobacterales bacterium]